MDQTDRNALDYESCRRIWRRVSPELNPYPEEKGGDGLPGAPAPDLKGLQEMIEGELGDRRAYLEAARRRPSRRPADDAADGRPGGSPRPAAAGGVLPACGQCYRPAPGVGAGGDAALAAAAAAAVSSGGLRRPAIRSGRPKRGGTRAWRDCSGS